MAVPFLAALGLMLTNVIVHIIYMVLYGHLLNPGQPEEHYNLHAQLSGPWSSFIAGIPLTFLWALWSARSSRWFPYTFSSPIAQACAVWAVYQTADVAIVAMMASPDSAMPAWRLYLIVAGCAVSKLCSAVFAGMFVRTARSYAFVRNNKPRQQ
jgi:hypothetical protein